MNFLCELIAHLYFISEVYAAGIKQWTVRDVPNFEDLILKLGWMIWAIIYYSHHLVCLDHRLIMCNLVWGYFKVYYALKGFLLEIWHLIIILTKICLWAFETLCIWFKHIDAITNFHEHDV